MEITDIIGIKKAFEPPFRRRGKSVRDKNLRTLVQLKAQGTLNNRGDIADSQEAGREILEHICYLLNHEHLQNQTIKANQSAEHLIEDSTIEISSQQNRGLESKDITDC